MDASSSSPSTPTPVPAPMMSPVSPTPAPAVESPKSSKGGLVVAVIVLLLLAGYVAWAWTSDSWPFAPLEPVASETPSPSVSADTTGWKTYKNELYGFEFMYSPIMTLGPEKAVNQISLAVLSDSTSDSPCLELGCPPEYGFYKSFGAGSNAQGGGRNPIFVVDIGRGSYAIHFWMQDANQDCGEKDPDCDVYNSKITDEKTLVNDSNYAGFNALVGLLTTLKYTTPADMTGWQKYTNAEFGFELRYPGEVETIGDTAFVKFKSDLGEFGVQILDFPLDLDGISQERGNITLPTHTINGTVWYEFGEGDGPLSSLIFAAVHNGLQYKLTFPLTAEEGSTEKHFAYSEIMNILSTFKFTK